ncbi:MAG: asparagine synthase-related protein [bacterium]|nr:asparagine synthase-related protein [bacterium]
MFSSKFEHCINEEIHHHSMAFGRSVINTIPRDRLLEESESYVFGLEGVLFNRQIISKDLNAVFLEEGINFITRLEGQFSGFFYHKPSAKFYVFTDQLSTKPIYYYYDKRKSLFCFSSECKFISSLLFELKLACTINIDSLKMLLGFGYLLNDNTPINEAKKLPYGSILELNMHSFDLSIKKYFQISKAHNDLSLEENISKIDELLLEAVSNEWKITELHCDANLSHLSGGLDSRVNLLIAHELGFRNLHTITFSHKGTLDEIVASEIANDIQTVHNFYELNEQFLHAPIKNFIQANDGVNLFYNAAHTFTVTNHYQLQKVGAVHTGQIGDVLFGSFSNRPPINRDYIQKLAFRFDPEIFFSINDVENYIEPYIKDGGAELFSLEQRQINGTMSGDRIVSHLVDHLSPFYNRKLLEFCYSIPDRFKKNEQIYLEWFNRYHPKISEFRWQKNGFKPTSAFKVSYGNLQKKVFKKLFSLFGRSYQNMNPFQYWFEQSDSTIKLYDSYREEISTSSIDDELKRLLLTTYSKGKAIDKMTAISVFHTIKLYSKT